MKLKKYNVYDTEEEKYIMKDVTMDLLQIQFRYSANKISQYICQGYKLNNRYIISHADKNKEEPTEPEEALMHLTHAQREKHETEWNEIRTAFKLLQTGHGKLATVNGKKCVVMK